MGQKWNSVCCPISIWVHYLSRYLEGQCHSMTLKQNCVLSITLFFEVGFYNYFTEIITIVRWRVTNKFGSLPWRSRSQHDLAAKSCLANNVVIRSRILQLFHRNDHHIELTCRAQHLGRYLEGQGHSKTMLQKTCPVHNCVIWSRILQLFDRNDHYNKMMTLLIVGSLRTILHYT